MKKVIKLLLFLALMLSPRLTVQAAWSNVPEITAEAVYDEASKNVKLDLYISAYDHIAGIQFDVVYDSSKLVIRNDNTDLYKPFENASYASSQNNGKITYIWAYNGGNVEGSKQNLVTFFFDTCNTDTAQTKISIENIVLVDDDVNVKEIDSSPSRSVSLSGKGNISKESKVQEETYVHINDTEGNSDTDMVSGGEKKTEISEERNSEKTENADNTSSEKEKKETFSNNSGQSEKQQSKVSESKIEKQQPNEKSKMRVIGAFLFSFMLVLLAVVLVQYIKKRK